MGKEGVDKTVLFSTLVHPETAEDYKGYKNELNRLYQVLNGDINPTEARIQAIDELKQVISRFPGKFVGFGSCPLGFGLHQTQTWIETYIIKNHFYGIGELTPGSGKINLLEPLFKSLTDYPPMPLWIHTFNPLNNADLVELVELSRRFPLIPVIFGHGGGSYWLDLLEAIKEMNQAYFDISASFTAHSLQMASRLIPNRVLFSVDMPYGNIAVMKKLVDESIPDPKVKELVLSENIQHLLNI
jgi:predicted TIM-barrel fold metal-dependent hydrolase